MQAVVDSHCIFMAVYIGWPGKVHDARVFVNSSFYKEMVNETLFSNWKRRTNGVDISLLVLGDPAYPALPWLMKPYAEHVNMTLKQRNYNYRQSRGRMTVENSFRRLKGRWRCLLKRLDCQVFNVGNIVASCVVLHNMCEMLGDECLAEWIDNFPVPTRNCPPAVQDEGNSVNNIRDTIANFLYH